MTAQAEESKTYGDFTYEEAKDGITITKYKGDKKKVVIPDKINGTEVISIGDSAFWNCSSFSHRNSHLTQGKMNLITENKIHL